MRSNIIRSLPLFGILTFLLLYVKAASVYPGGSQFDSHSVGFSWFHNYWCNLFNEFAINDQVNPARLFAIWGMIVLCSSLGLFFYLFAEEFASSQINKRIIQVTGFLSMFVALFIFSKWHDLLIIISSLLGLVALLFVVLEFTKSTNLSFKILGICCLVLILVNNIIYYSAAGLYYLPALQKITFILVLSWIVGMNINMLKKSGI